MPVPEYVYLFRVPADAAQQQATAIRGMLEELCDIAGIDRALVQQLDRSAGSLTVVAPPGSPMQLAIGRVEDVLLISTSSRLASQSMKRLAERDEHGSLASREAMFADLGNLPPANASTMFFDVHGCVDFLAQTLRMAELAANSQGHGARKAVAAIGLASALLEELDVTDHIATSASSDGTSVTTTSLVRMLPGYRDSRVAKVFADREAWQDWSHLVPADATSFWFDAGFDPAALYDFVTALVGENLGDVPTIDPSVRETLDAISGEMAGMSFPPAGDGGCALGESVMMVRLDDAQGMTDRVQALLEHAAGFARSRGQAATVVKTGDQLALDLGAFPWIHPVIAVRDGMLVVATSSAALEHIDRVRRGEATSIADSPRFQSLGLDAPSAVRSLSYGTADVPAMGFPDLVSAAGFALSMLPEKRDTREARIAARMLTKLAPALRDLQMGYTVGSVALPSQDDGVFLGRMVVRYSGER